MLPGKPEGAGPAPHSADPQPQQPQASQQAGHEAERLIKAAGPQPEQPGEAGVKLKPEAVGSPKPSPAPSTSTMGAAGAPEEGAAAAAAATAAAAAGGGHAGQPPGKAPAAGGKQGNKKVVRSKEEFNEVRAGQQLRCAGIEQRARQWASRFHRKCDPPPTPAVLDLPPHALMPGVEEVHEQPPTGRLGA